MKVYVDYVEKCRTAARRRSQNRPLEVNLNETETVSGLKQKLKSHFRIDMSLNRRIVVEYAKCDLLDEWPLSELNIPMGATLKCYVVDERQLLFDCYVKFSRELKEFYATDVPFALNKCYVLELRIFLANIMGFPLSLFRLKEALADVQMFDDNRLVDYVKLEDEHGKKRVSFVLEVWHGWDALLKCSIRGMTSQVFGLFSQDEAIKQYQMSVVLYVAAAHGNFNLVSELMTMGARIDRPIGEHPCRQWCQVNYKQLQTKKNLTRLEYLKLEHLKCPIHIAVQNGQLKILTLIAKRYIYLLEQRDGYNMPPWRLALHNQHKDPAKNLHQKDVARFLLAKEFGTKINLNERVTISLHLYYKIKCWIDQAQEKNLTLRGFHKSSLKRRPVMFMRQSTESGGLCGNTVLVDGFNNQFKEHPNAYERLRDKHKYYYFINDQDRDKFGLPELYFRTAGLLKKPPEAPPKLSRQSSILVRPNRKTYSLWRRALNKLLVRLTVIKYFSILQDINALETVNDLNLNVFRLPGAPHDDKRRHTIFRPNEFLKRSSIANLIPPPPTSSRDLKSSREIYDASVSYFEQRYKQFRMSDHMSKKAFLQPRQFMKETSKLFKTYKQLCQPRQEETAETILEHVSRFRAKSGVQQVNIGIKLAVNNVKQSLKRAATASIAAERPSHTFQSAKIF